MKFGIYPGGRAGTVCSRPPDPAAIRGLVDDLAGGRPFVIREYVHFFDDATPPDVIASLGADHDLARLTMPDEWYVEGAASWTWWRATSSGPPIPPDGWRSSTPSSTATATWFGASR